MQLIVHVKGFFEWVDVPADVERDTPEWNRALKAGKIKPLANGAWSMLVPKEAETHMNVGTNEDDVVQVIVQEMCRGDRRHLTRDEAIVRLIARHLMHHHAHPTDVEEVQVVDDSGPDEKLFLKIMKEHIDCHNIDPRDLDGLLEAYKTESTFDDLQDSFHRHFNVKPERLEAFKVKREEKESTLRAARQHHVARMAAAAAKKEGES